MADMLTSPPVHLPGHAYQHSCTRTAQHRHSGQTQRRLSDTLKLATGIATGFFFGGGSIGSMTKGDFS
eukprot:2114647-Rhodomonas_salina.1